MPKFSDADRLALIAEYPALRASGMSDAKIARRWGVSQMTMLRWKKEHAAAFAAAEERYRSEAGGFHERAADYDAGQITAATEEPAELGWAEDDGPQWSQASRSTAEPSGAPDELAWLRDLAKQLLLENERLKAKLAGKLR